MTTTRARLRPSVARGSVIGPPDFIGVGALGSGIGWWHAHLLAHPEIAAPAGRQRALHHFDRFCATEMTDADVVAYHKRFRRRGDRITGEWTGRYMLDPWTPPLLRRAAADAKLLVILADPIERYRVVLADRLARYSDTERFSMADAVDRRCHGAQLARLHRFYDPARILVLQLERCHRDPLGQYRRTLEFLGVRDTAFVPRGLRRKVAGRPESIPVAALLRLGLPAGTRRRMARLVGRAGPDRPPEPLWPDLKAALHTALDPDVAALRTLAPDVDLELWPNFAHLAVGERATAA
jgi:hypothetical protein